MTDHTQDFDYPDKDGNFLFESLGSDGEDAFEHYLDKMPYFKLNDNFRFRFESIFQNTLSTNRVTKDKQEAMQLVIEKAENNDSVAQFVMGWHSEHGVKNDLSNIFEKRSPNYKLALDWYERSYKNGLTFAAHQAGVVNEIQANNLLFKGNSKLAEDFYKEAASWYQKEINDIKSRHLYDVDAFKGPSWPERTDGYASHISMVRLYAEGLGVKKNLDKALELLNDMPYNGIVENCDDQLNTSDAKESLMPFIVAYLFYSDNVFCIDINTRYGVYAINKHDDEGYLFTNTYKNERYQHWMNQAVDLGSSKALEELIIEEIMNAHHYQDWMYDDGSRWDKYFEESKKHVNKIMTYLDKHDLLGLGKLNELLDIIDKDISKKVLTDEQMIRLKQLRKVD
jgi:TPR repeat protein